MLFHVHHRRNSMAPYSLLTGNSHAKTVYGNHKHFLVTVRFSYISSSFFLFIFLALSMCCYARCVRTCISLFYFLFMFIGFLLFFHSAILLRWCSSVAQKHNKLDGGFELFSLSLDSFLINFFFWFFVVFMTYTIHQSEISALFGTCSECGCLCLWVCVLKKDYLCSEYLILEQSNVCKCNFKPSKPKLLLAVVWICYLYINKTYIMYNVCVRV